MTGGLVWLTLVAFVLSAGTTVAMMKAGTRLGLLDEPGAHRSHDSTTPRAGGVGIAAALVAVLAAFLGASDVVEPRFLYAVLAGVIVIAGIGLADDRLSLPSWPRCFSSSEPASDGSKGPIRAIASPSRQFSPATWAGSGSSPTMPTTGVG